MPDQSESGDRGDVVNVESVSKLTGPCDVVNGRCDVKPAGTTALGKHDLVLLGSEPKQDGQDAYEHNGKQLGKDGTVSGGDDESVVEDTKGSVISSQGSVKGKDDTLITPCTYADTGAVSAKLKRVDEWLTQLDGRTSHLDTTVKGLEGSLEFSQREVDDLKKEKQTLKL